MILIKTIPTWIAALAMVLNGLSSAGMVLCIGSDGHVALENLCTESLETIACCTPEHLESETSFHEDDNCGGCTDLAFRVNPLRNQSRLADEMPPVNCPAIMPPSLLALTSATPRLSAFSRPETGISSGLRAVRLVVLRL